MSSQSATGSALTMQAPKPRLKRQGKSRDRQQAVAIQRILEATILDPATQPQSRASCAVAWSRIQEAKRIMDGKPLPGNLRPELMQASQAKRIGPPARIAPRIMPKPAAVPIPQQSMLSPADPPDAAGAAPL